MKWKIVLLVVLLHRTTIINAQINADNNQELKFLQDYVSEHRVTRMVAISNDGSNSEKETITSWFENLPVFIKVFSTANSTKPVSPVGTDVIPSDEGDNSNSCRERCTAFLVVMTVRNAHQLKLFMMIYSKDEFRKVSWIVFGAPGLLTDLSERYIALDNQIVFVLWKPDEDSAELWEVYKPAPNLFLRTEQIGSWSPKTSLQQNGPREPFSRRRDLTGLHLRVSTVYFAPFIMYDTNQKGELDITGNHADIFYSLQESLNFTSSIFASPDNAFGAFDVNTGMMNGMIGQLQRGLADIAINAIDVIPIRSKYVDFGLTMDSFGHFLVLGRPGRIADWKSYTAEFSYGSWIMLIVISVILVFVLAFFSKTSPKEIQITFSDASLFVLSALCNISFPHYVRNLSTRTMVASLFLTTVIVYTYYTSFLTAKLAVIRIKMPFSDLQGLYDNRDEYQLGVLGQSSIIDLWRTSNETFLKNLWTDMMEPYPENQLANYAAIPARMSSGKFVFLFYASAYVPSKETISLPGQYFKVPMAWPMQKNSPLIPVFDHNYRHLIESGQYSQLWNKRKTNIIIEGPVTRALGYTEMFTAFALLGCGMVLSILIVAAEIFAKKMAFCSNTKED